MFSDYEIHENSKTWTANLMAEADHIRQARAASPERPEPTYKPRRSVWAFFANRLRPAHA